MKLELGITISEANRLIQNISQNLLFGQYSSTVQIQFNRFMTQLRMSIMKCYNISWEETCSLTDSRVLLAYSFQCLEDLYLWAIGYAIMEQQSTAAYA